MTRPVTALLCACLLCRAQQEPPTFRTTTTLIEFTVVALDSKGKPITDLTREEVSVTENGKPRNLAVFRFEGGVEPAPVPPALPPGTFTNRAEYSPGPPRNITALVLDTLNTPPSEQVWVRAQAMRYLRTLPPQTRIGIYGLGQRMTVWHDFTGDTDSLRARIEKIATQVPIQQTTDIARMTAEAEQLLESLPPEERETMQKMLEAQINSDMEANRIAGERRLAITLVHLESLGLHLAGIPGRKNLVWISGGISMLAITGAMGFGPRGSITSYEERVKITSRRLASQGVTMYLVDSRGLAVQPEFDAGATAVPRRGGVFERQRQAAQITADPHPAMHLMAEVTGGRVVKNTNDTTEGMKAAAADLLGAYSMGFYAEGEPDNKWHRLNVKVKRSGVKLSHPQGYLSDPPAPPARDWSPAEWNAAVLNPVGSTTLPLDARCESAKDGSGKLYLLLQIPARGLHFRRVENELVADIEIGIAEKTPSAEYTFRTDRADIRVPANDPGRIANAALHYRNEWKGHAGASSIRVVVRDPYTGRHGTLDVPASRIPGAN